jgi:hypothetical protein
MAQKKNPVAHASKASVWTNPDIGSMILIVEYMTYYLEQTGMGSFRLTNGKQSNFQYYGKIQQAG